MEFVNEWAAHSIDPSLGGRIALGLAVLVTIALAIRVTHVARKSKTWKPASLALAAIPVAIIAAGVVIDDVRENQHETYLAESGMVDRAWAEIEESVQEKYYVSDVEPLTTKLDTAASLAEAATSSDGYTAMPKVIVKAADNGSTFIYTLQLNETGVALERQPHDEETAHPDGLLTQNRVNSHEL